MSRELHQFQARRCARRRHLRLGLLDPDEKVHAFVRKALRTGDAGWVLEAHCDFQDALRAISRSPPNVLVTEILLPEVSEIEHIQKLTAVAPRLPIVVLTSSEETALLWQCLQSGALGYLMKPASAEGLLRAISKARQGLPFLCQEAQVALVKALRTTSCKIARLSLTAREREVMECLSQKLSDKDIAERLGMAAGTVHVHCRRLFRKLRSHGRGDAVAKFLGLRRAS
jgi:DNA-binding NarL/FixJ family response regulator